MNLTKSSETRNQYMVMKDRFLIQVYKNKENKRTATHYLYGDKNQRYQEGCRRHTQEQEEGE